MFVQDRYFAGAHGIIPDGIEESGIPAFDNRVRTLERFLPVEPASVVKIFNRDAKRSV